VTISAARRRQNEDSIRAAIDRLLRGQIPAGAGCDVKTLAQEAGVSRAALYRSYAHLKEEFERRLTHMRAEGHLPDLKSVQIIRLKDENTALRRRLADREHEVTELTGFKTTAISRLAAQHAEITRLRATLAAHGNVRALPLPALAPPEHPPTAGTHSRGH
jgi:hypothetical protein